MRPTEFVLSTNSNYPVEIKSEYEQVEDSYESDRKNQTDAKPEKTFAKNAKNRRKATVPLRASPLRESLGEESQTSQSSLEDSSNSPQEAFVNNEELYNIEEIIQNESQTQASDASAKTEKTKDEFKSKSDIKCNMCKKLFQYKSEFDSHYQSAYNRTPVYTCMFCNKTMENYSTFRTHCYRHITEGRFKCEDCGQGFPLQSLLRVHILGKHSKVKPFHCEDCGKEFATKSGLNIHGKRHQSEIKEQYTCAECGKILHTRGGLTSHMNVHRLGRRFMCDVCGKTFTQKVNMQQHVKQHTGDKPYECDMCGKAFAEKSHLSRHKSFHTEDRPFKCETCGKMYKTDRCLKVHRHIHDKERPYVCTHCNKGFLSSTKLKQHCNIHTGERPYACKYCERKFTNYPNWLKHTRRKHNVDHKTGKDLPAKDNPAKHNASPPSDPVDSNVNRESAVKLEVKSETKQRINIDNIGSYAIEFDPKAESYTAEYLDYDDALPLPHLESIEEPIHHDNLTTDFKLSKHEEMYLQERILNFPITYIEPREQAAADGQQLQTTSSMYNVSLI